MTPQDAIDKGLHVGGFRTPLGGPGFRKPRAVTEDGGVVVRDSDCEPRRSEETWTREKWDEAVEKGGLWRSVGMWSFAPWDDPAAGAVAFAHRNPDSAGREIHRLRNRRCETCRHWDGELNSGGRGECRKLHDLGRAEIIVKFEEMPLVAWPECGHGGPAVTFESRPDFGCNLWEKK